MAESHQHIILSEKTHRTITCNSTSRRCWKECNSESADTRLPSQNGPRTQEGLHFIIMWKYRIQRCWHLVGIWGRHGVTDITYIILNETVVLLWRRMEPTHQTYTHTHKHSQASSKCLYLYFAKGYTADEFGKNAKSLQLPILTDENTDIL